VSFITTGFRELTLKVRRQRTRIALRHEKRLLQRSEIALGRAGTAEAAKFPEVRNEIVALKKFEQEQKEVAARIAKIEEALKKIDAQRQADSREQAAALAKLEDEKRPILTQRNDAKTVADRCDNELATVDRRLSDHDSADRDLLKKVEALQAVEPPPNDFQDQMTRLSTQRARFPRERGEMEKARLGSEEACRNARQRLTAADEQLAQMEKKIAKVRGEFEAHDRELNESARVQEEEVRQARQQHQTVEEKKNPAYLNIGRHLASQGIAPPSAPHLLVEVQRRRGAVDHHAQHKAELADLSKKIDKQELRKFYFTIFSLLALLAIILPLVSQSPAKRDWLPQATSAILSLDIEQFNKSPLARRWSKEQPEIWQKVVIGLFGEAAHTPGFNLAQDASRVTRALTTNDLGHQEEYVLVESKGDLAPVIRSIAQDKSFTSSTVTGLVVFQGRDVSVARVGPRTLAVGSLGEVEHLVHVRLGTEADLKIDDPLLQRFQALEASSVLRLVFRTSSEPGSFFGQLFSPDLTQATRGLGLSMNLEVPSKARLIVWARDPEKAKNLAASLQNEAARWLALPGSDFVLTTEPPKVEQKNDILTLDFQIPEGASRLLLQRLAKVPPAAVSP